MGRDEKFVKIKNLGYERTINVLEKLGEKHFEDYFLFLYKVEFKKSHYSMTHHWKKGEFAIAIQGERYGQTFNRWLYETNDEEFIEWTQHYRVKDEWFGEMLFDGHEDQQDKVTFTPLEWKDGKIIERTDLQH